MIIFGGLCNLGIEYARFFSGIKALISSVNRQDLMVLFQFNTQYYCLDHCYLFREFRNRFLSLIQWS